MTAKTFAPNPGHCSDAEWKFLLNLPKAKLIAMAEKIEASTKDHKIPALAYAITARNKALAAEFAAKRAAEAREAADLGLTLPAYQAGIRN